MSNRKKTTPAMAKDVIKVMHVGLDRQVTVEMISDADWQRTSYEADVIDAFRRGARTCENAKKAARMLDWSTSKFYRKLKAYEEAGLIGDIGKRAVGHYHYDKRLRSGSTVPCRVDVFPLDVTGRLADWPEKAQREAAWFTPDEAAARVEEAGLADLLRHLPDELP